LSSDKKVTEFILEALEKEGIGHIFLVPGGVIDPLAIELANRYRSDNSHIRPIVAAHEGGAAFMADGYSRASLSLKEKKFGVCMGIGGPGVTNMMTAVSAAYADRSPFLIIAGRIPSDLEGNGTFQDSSSSLGIDDITLMRPMTEFAASVTDVDAVSIFLRKAIRAIRDVESLPAFLSISRDVQLMECKGCSYIAPAKGSPRIIDREEVMDVPEIIKQATYVAILAGNGAVRSQASCELKRFADTYGIPVLTTLRAKGVLPEDDSMSLGVFGEGGSLWAKNAILSRQIEVLLVLGATLNANNTFAGAALQFFPRGRKLILVDINPNSNRDIEYDYKLVIADVKTFLDWMKQNKTRYHEALMKSRQVRQKWVQAIKDNDERYDKKDDRVRSDRPLHPARVIADLRQAANNCKARNAVVVVDSGAHTFFTGHHWESYGPGEFLFLSTTGPMGYGIALGIGAWLARPNQPCICIMGDGSMLMHGMELRTAVRYGIPLIVIVINNKVLGNVFLRYEQLHEHVAAEKIAKLTPPQEDWVTFAKSLGTEGICIDDPRDLIMAYRKAFLYTREEKKPFVIDVICHNKYDTPNSTNKFLKEMAKWSRSQQEMKTAINELSARGGMALPALEEILNITAHEDIKAACTEAIKAIKEKKEGKEEYFIWHS
jgi:acetolactate synthase I/II/III large subunit